MSVKDIGPEPQTINIEDVTKDNSNYRTTVWTGKYLQTTVMSIPVGESIGLETHPETDQFIRIEDGTGKCVMGDSAEELTFEQNVEDDWAIFVPAGKWHDIINTGDKPLKLYTIYAPVHHAHGIVQATAADAEADEESGKDVPPEWTVQPGSGKEDGHA
jgi:mannose-6-phosphate isomerase-like protein (cupin superfamily)